jgi:acetate---CoA ligase (ADP-forming) subunit beta
MKEAQAIIDKALGERRTSLSEYEAKHLLRLYGIPVTREVLVEDRKQFLKAATDIGYPLVIKGCSPDLTHKTERNLVRVDIRNAEEAGAAFEDLMSRLEGETKSLLVQEMVRGSRELVVGMTRDPQFGPCVMFGLGGIYTEILRDVSFRVAPLEKRDAIQMTQEIRGRKILEAVRGMPAADMEMLCQILIKAGEIGLEHGAIREIDINPLILSGNKPVAVDALVVLSEASALS